MRDEAMHTAKGLLVGTLAICCGLSAHGAGIFRVDAASTAVTPNGQTWAKAYKTLQAGTDAASSAGGGEVWVKAGTYTAKTNPVLTMKSGVAIYGGFAGTETAREQRNWSTNPTSIDGESVRRCVHGADASALDGFVVAHGYTHLNGGGMYNYRAAPTVNNCTFIQNSGTAMSNVLYTPSVTNCMFIQNEGGGMINSNCSPSVTNCTFVKNVNKVGRGGGMSNSSYSSPQLVNCTFLGNSAPYSASAGGAIYNQSSSSPSLTNCILWGDTAPSGAEISNYDATSVPVVAWSCVQGGYAGTGNMDADPLFVGGSTGMSAQLRKGSPCIDAGTATGAPAADILGRPRPAGMGVDMGAYEGAVAATAVVSLTIRALPATGGTTCPVAGTHTFARGDTVTVSASGSAEMRFDHWSDAATGTNVSVSVTLAGDATLTANFVPNCVYVDKGSTPGRQQDGRTWATAYSDINTGITAAVKQVWVKEGTYTSGVTLNKNVTLYGGFAGTETALEQRDWNAHPTIIDGGGGVDFSRTSTLDGFTITRGGASIVYDYRDDSGHADVTIRNCTFRDNGTALQASASADQGATILPGLSVADCLFTGNSGAVALSTSAYSHRSGSGWINATTELNASFSRCVFSGNGSAGVSVHAYGTSDWYSALATSNAYALFWHCTFYATGIISGCTTSGGTDVSASPSVIHSIMWNASPLAGDVTCNPTATDSCIQGGYPGTGNISDDPLFMATPGDLHLQPASPCIGSGTDDDMGAYEYTGSKILGGIVINNGAKNTPTPDVTLSLNWSSISGSPVTRMRFSDDGAHWTLWEPVAATRAYTLPAGDGYHTVRVQYRDAVGNLSDRLNDYILLDGTPPTGTIVINGGASATKDPNVTLSLTWSDATGSGVTRMRFSDNGSTWTAWEPLQATKSHVLPLPPGGHQTVRVQFRDSAGNYSARFNDYIRLDLTP
jgi:hypothetical protein